MSRFRKNMEKKIRERAEVGSLFKTFLTAFGGELSFLLDEPFDVRFIEDEKLGLCIEYFNFSDYIEILKQRELERMSLGQHRRVYGIGDVAELVKVSKASRALRGYLSVLSAHSCERVDPSH